MHTSIKKLGLALGLIVCLLGMFATAHAVVRLPHGEFLESTEDLKVKVLGGYVSMTRTWDKGQWHFNPAWNSLKFTYDSLDGSVKSIDLVGAEYKKTTPGTFVLDASSFIKVTATGYRWQNKTGNWVDYNAQGVIQTYSDRNDIKVSFQYDATGKRTGVFDHYGNQVLWYEYTGDQLTAIRDATNRRVTYGYTGNDLTTVVDVLNNTWRYAYLSPTKLSVRTDPENRTLTLTYDGGGRVASAKDRDNIGYTYEYDYDANKREYFVRQRTSGGKITETWYNAQGVFFRKDINGKTLENHSTDTASRTKASTDARGLTTTVTRDQWDNVIKTVYPDGTGTSATYDPHYSNLLTSTDEKGTITKYEYDAKGNLTRLTEALGLPEQRITESSNDQYGQLKTVNRKGNPSTNTLDAITQYDYDLNGNVIQITDAENHVTRYPTEDYDIQGNSKKMIDARGKVWTRTYDNKGNVLTETDPLNHTNATGYDRAGWRTSTTDAAGNVTRYVYDDRQNVTAITDPYGLSTRYTYDSDSRRTQEIDRAGKIQRYEYGLDDRLAKTIDGNNNVTQYVYGDEASGLNGLLVKVVYPTFSQEYKYDTRNRVTQSIDVLDATTRQTTTTTYDSLGNVAMFTDAANRATQITYDALNRLTKLSDPLNGSKEYTYDTRGNPISVKDPEGNTHRFAYDRNGRKLSWVRPLGQTTLYSYDEVGKLSQTTDPKNQVKKYTYNDSGILIQEQHFLTAVDPSPAKSITFTFNDLSLPTGYNDGIIVATNGYDARQLRKLQENVNYGAFSLSYSYTYSAAEQKQSVIYPDGSTYTYAYDSNNQLSSILLPTGSITYNAYKNTAPTQMTLPGGTTRTRDYDPLLRLKDLQVKDPTQNVVMSYQYSRDASGNIKTRNTERGNYTYSYDDLDRLTNVTAPILNEVYTYGPVSNRLTDSRTASPWGYNGNNQLLSMDGISYEYDANGNTTKKSDANNPANTHNYVYDTSDRLIEVLDSNNALIAAYSYDPKGRRLSKDTNNIKTHFFYADEGLIAETDSVGAVIKTYGYAPGTAFTTDPLFLKVGSTGAYYFFQNDHIGTPQRLTALNGETVWSATYDAFGAAVVDSTSTITINLRYPGQYYDEETGQHYNWNRYYDPSTGRYITSDPIGLEGGLNTYTYALANPVTNIDPTGLDTTGCNKVPGAVEGPCTLKCCAIHDQCYKENTCSSGSWPWPIGDRKKNKCDAGPKCQRCNSQVTACFVNCASKTYPRPPPPTDYYCAKTGTFVAAPDNEGCNKDHECKDC